MTKVAVVILNWNGRTFLEKFLQGVLTNSLSAAEVIIADNASTDDSVIFLRSRFPHVRIIENSVNGGFAKGYNDALKKVEAEYYVLLNSDVEVAPGWIEPVIQLMDRDNSIAACQPKLLSFHNRNQFEYAGGAGGYIDKYGYPFCRGRIFDSFENDNGQYNDTREVHWATGACLFIRASAFHKAGGLDEDFFAHMEEIDLCWRLKNTGHKVMYCAQSMVYHVGAGTLAKNSPRKTYLNFRNNLILLCKNHAHQFFWIKLFLRMTLDAIAGLKFLLSGDVDHFVAVLKAHGSFYSTFSRTLQKRKQLKKEVKVYSTSAIYNRSIVVDYFIRGKKYFGDLPADGFIS
ncbi:MAG: glycosyltransferase family 2 protein [Bacteroidetes bacterium]|nr:glycosyltransferase family 2 protein [Bacteroidota bacterium]